MKTKGAWALLSFLTCFAFNAVLAFVIYYMANRILEGLNELISPFVGAAGAGLSDDMRSALNNVRVFLGQLHQYMVPVLSALTVAVTLPLWFCIYLLGRGQRGQTSEIADRVPCPPAGVEEAVNSNRVPQS